MRQRVTQIVADGLEWEETVFDEQHALRRPPAAVRRTSIRGPAVVNATEIPKMNSPLFLWSIVCCYLFNTMGQSVQAGISALYWNNVWGLGPDFTGILLCLGEILGIVILSFLSHPRVFGSPVTRPFAQPANILCAGIAMGVSCFMVAADNLVVAAIGTVSLLGCNTCVMSFQGELLALSAPSESFGTWSSRCCATRRLANGVCIALSMTVCGFFGPQNSFRLVAAWLWMYGLIMCLVYGAMGVLPVQLWFTEALARKRKLEWGEEDAHKEGEVAADTYKGADGFKIMNSALGIAVPVFDQFENL